MWKLFATHLNIMPPTMAQANSIQKNYIDCKHEKCFDFLHFLFMSKAIFLQYVRLVQCRRFVDCKPPKENTSTKWHLFWWMRVYVLSVYIVILFHSFSIPLHPRWEKLCQKIPRIDIFNNSFYYNSSVRATACRIFCQRKWRFGEFSIVIVCHRWENIHNKSI